MTVETFTCNIRTQSEDLTIDYAHGKIFMYCMYLYFLQCVPAQKDILLALAL